MTNKQTQAFEVKMEKYDPSNSIDSEKWLALDEATQIELIRDFHKELVFKMPVDALEIHSSIHVIVENQLAMGVELIPETIAKLTRQGLDRHEAIHAIGAIISEYIIYPKNKMPVTKNSVF